jgi:glycosyltransferase involved in cell wall biosynthesis
MRQCARMARSTRLSHGLPTAEVRVLFAAPGYKPAWRIGGPVVSVSSLAEELTRLGHEVSVYTTNANLDEDLDVRTDRPLQLDGVEVSYFRRSEPLRRWFPHVPYLSKASGYLYAPRMRAALDELVPTMDVVHTHLPFTYPTYAAAHAAFRHGKPLFYHQRGVFDPQRLRFRSLKKMLFIRAFERPIVRRAAGLFALTEAERESYRRLGGIDAPCWVVPNGIHLPGGGGEDDAAELRTLDVQRHQTLVLFLGRLHPIKGADVLLDAFLDVQGSLPDAVLVLAGPDEFGLEAEFRRRADTAGVQARVLFPGMVQGRLKAALLRRADLFCLPSVAEGFSMAVLEALAHSTAVLLSPGCNFPAAEAAQAGRIVERTRKGVAAGLTDLLSDRGRLASMGAAGRRLVEREYTWRSVAERTLAAYREGIERYAARSAAAR